MKNYSFWACCATLGPVGYVRAPGTLATFLTLPIVWLTRTTITAEWQYGIIMAVLALVVFICIHKARSSFPGKQDPSSIVLDECLGTFITFWAITAHLQWFVIGFVLFRFFDIVKLCGIKECERIKGSLGIVLDDVVAALLANLILQVAVRYIPVYF